MTGNADSREVPLPGQPAGTIPGAGTRLTFPAYDVGAADILAGGKHAGICLAEFSRWRAYLYPVLAASRIRTDLECEEVTGRTLGELRRVLRERVAAEGPWWTA